MLNIKELYLSLREYTSGTKFAKPIDEMLKDIDQKINELTGQLKLKFINRMET